MKNYIKLSITGIILSFILSLVISCRGTNDSVESQKGPASVKVILKGDDFSDTGNIGTQASNGKTGISSDLGIVQKQEITFKNNDDYKLVATLTPVASAHNTAQVSSKANLIAATEINPLPNGIRYKVVVFDNNGNYVTEQDYVSGQAGSDITGLDGGSTYTFIVYSIGSSTDLPIVTYVDPLNKTLATASVNSVSVGNSDLMYFSKTMTVSGNGTNYLDTVLRHKYSQIITTLDSSPTLWYSIDTSSINGAAIAPHNNSSSLQLSDGSVSSTNPMTKSLTFPASGTSTTTTAAPVIISTPAITNGIFVMGSIRLISFGGTAAVSVTHSSISLTNLRISPGVKYNLRLSFVPNDRYYANFRGYPAVKINGIVFMRHNLGSNYLADPDVPNPNIVGNYYQWGRSTPVANVATGAGPISGWDNTTIPPVTSWNTGTRITPAKNTANDPCPTGWRVGSRNELGILVNTPYSTLGNTTTTDPGSAVGVFTSSFNTAVKITFPFTGFRDGTNGSYIPGTTNVEGQYWPSDSNWFGSYTTGGMTYFSYSSGNAIGFRGMPVRCVAEYPY
ncbi:hypothetical protein HZQ64_04940 [Elizabethkingia anophelis]|uniref:fibrobacter succinogenes major paralogous domain-containing protein n=1 Tax=Elizabethkingia anophelis TaxID=1117645 RepID=UPI0021A8D43B|nr:hypothetical protein [Elizabethkingia anophelis]MCT3722907.1 hypothetical protein [Elizabethkingia anophelis]MCT3734063.1 hypothetical protein [Elizabethkingia anophelis]MCT3754746.1 hypothetical protein [Elizabethkingia anophelis]MCT3776047.1 hypothetical protein [Elizabethkingia anophelis]